ncbi:MAG: hypothetical protein KY464_12290 [Gemmatimonadetes bacterium]|nr:hypothetical protein [Gemmatimonadota bacterium]
MINRLIIIALTAVAAACAKTPTVTSDEPMLRGTITGIGRDDSASSSPDSLHAVRTVVVRSLGSSQAGSLGRCYRDAVLTVSKSTKVRRSTGQSVGTNALLVGQVVSVWTEPTFPLTSVCRPGATAALIEIESDSPL